MILRDASVVLSERVVWPCGTAVRTIHLIPHRLVAGAKRVFRNLRRTFGKLSAESVIRKLARCLAAAQPVSLCAFAGLAGDGIGDMPPTLSALSRQLTGRIARLPGDTAESGVLLFGARDQGTEKRARRQPQGSEQHGTFRQS
ncbi:MAG: hypothetical protein HIU92_21620 [Proteobacteria bacterium]|nr:hypothetical protein [Pseudomonadota bacterium]